MAVVTINGQREQASCEFASQSIRNAYKLGAPWDAENYLLVEIGDVFPAWITKTEQEELSKLTDIDEIDQFATDLKILALAKEDFDKWRLSSKE